MLGLGQRENPKEGDGILADNTDVPGKTVLQVVRHWCGKQRSGGHSGAQQMDTQKPGLALDDGSRTRLVRSKCISMAEVGTHTTGCCRLAGQDALHERTVSAETRWQEKPRV